MQECLNGTCNELGLITTSHPRRRLPRRCSCAQEPGVDENDDSQASDGQRTMWSQHMHDQTYYNTWNSSFPVPRSATTLFANMSHVLFYATRGLSKRQRGHDPDRKLARPFHYIPGPWYGIQSGQNNGQ